MKNLLFLILPVFLLASTQCAISAPAQKVQLESSTEMKPIQTKSGLVIFNYKDALKVSKRTDRKVMVIVAQAGCPAWETFAKDISSENIINKYLKDLYVVALIPSSELNKYPQYQTKISPTLFFINKDENIIAEPIKGLTAVDYSFATYLFDLAFYNTAPKK